LWDAGIDRRPVFKAQVELMFLGEFNHSIDEKGRVTIPSLYRQKLDGGAYITQGFDRNLMVLQLTTFENMANRLNRMNITDPSVRELRRLLFSNAQNIQLDGSGRMLIPPFLRDKLGQTNEIVMIGGGSYFELWSGEKWKAQMGHMDEVQNNARYFADLELFAEEIADE
jgi:MraZ protein